MRRRGKPAECDEAQATPEDAPGAPPREDGLRLGCVARPARGTVEETRVSLHIYGGAFKVGLRVWRCRYLSDSYWPLPGQGMMIPAEQARDVAAALLEAASLAEQHAGSPDVLGLIDPVKKQSDPERRPPRRRAGGRSRRSFGLYVVKAIIFNIKRNAARTSIS